MFGTESSKYLNNIKQGNRADSGGTRVKSLNWREGGTGVRKFFLRS